MDRPARTVAIAEAGWVPPTYPSVGQGVGPVEQVIIAQEFSTGRVSHRRSASPRGSFPHRRVRHQEQKQRFLPPTFRGEMVWCQLFSEPGAGSDLAGLSTKATRADGGWRITGQKIWTTAAQYSQWGALLATDGPVGTKT